MLLVTLEDVLATTAGRVAGMAVDCVERDSAVDRVERDSSTERAVEREAAGTAAATDRPAVVAVLVATRGALVCGGCTV